MFEGVGVKVGGRGTSNCNSFRSHKCRDWLYTYVVLGLGDGSVRGGGGGVRGRAGEGNELELRHEWLKNKMR